METLAYGGHANEYCAKTLIASLLRGRTELRGVHAIDAARKLPPRKTFF
jgi:hypothetical protein